MDIKQLPIELTALIVTADMATFLAALRVPIIGTLCCHEYIQNYAKRVFSTIEYSPGKTVYRLCNRVHRGDGPAIEFSSGTKMWYWGGALHREDGPAIEFFDGRSLWYLNGMSQWRSY